MKILIYTDYFKHTSGYAREVRDLIPLIIGAGHEVRYVGLGYNGFPPDFAHEVYPAEVDEASEYWGIEVLDYAINDFKPDIVFSIQDFFATKKIAFALSVPSASKTKWIHWGTLDGGPADHASRESIKWIDYVLYHSKFSQKEIEKVINGVQGETLYPAINPDTWHEVGDKEALRKEHGLDDRLIMVTCGRNQQRKNIPVLLDAMVELKKALPNILLIIASSVQTSTQDKGKSKKIDGYDYDMFIRERGLEDNVLMLRTDTGFTLSDDTLNTQYNLADVMVHPSWGEGFGLPIAEAGISGVPTIGGNHSSLTEVIGKGGILIDPKAYFYTQAGFRQEVIHPDDIVAAVKQYFTTSDTEREKMSKAAKQFAGKLTPERQAKKLLKIFDDVVKNDIKSVAKTELNI